MLKLSEQAKILPSIPTTVPQEVSFGTTPLRDLLPEGFVEDVHRKGVELSKARKELRRAVVRAARARTFPKGSQDLLSSFLERPREGTGLTRGVITEGERVRLQVAALLDARYLKFPSQKPWTREFTGSLSSLEEKAQLLPKVGALLLEITSAGILAALKKRYLIREAAE